MSDNSNNHVFLSSPMITLRGFGRFIMVWSRRPSATAVCLLVDLPEPYAVRFAQRVSPRKDSV